MLHLYTHVIPCSGFVRLGSTTCTNTQYQPAKHGGDAMLGRSSWSCFQDTSQSQGSEFSTSKTWLSSGVMGVTSEQVTEQPSTSVNGFNDCLVETCWNRDKQNGQNKRDRSWRSFLRAASCDLMVHHSTTAVATHVSCLLNKVSIHIFIIFTWPNSVEFQLNSGGERSQPSARHSAWRCAGITWTALGCFGISTPRFQNRRTCAIEQRRTAMKNYEQNQQHGQRPMRSLHLCVSLAVLPLTLDAWLESFMLSARTIQAS